MYPDFDRNLDRVIDLRATPRLGRGVALVLALVVAGLLGWYAARQLAGDADPGPQALQPR